MSKCLFTISFYLSGFCLFSQSYFTDMSLDEARRESKKQDKLLFVYAYAPDCEPCELFERYTLSDLEVSNYIKDQFIPLAMDMGDYPGLILAEELQVGIYPSMLFLDNNGKVVHRHCGAIEASELIEVAKNATSTESISAFDGRFEAGERDLQFLIDYLYLYEYACLDVRKKLKELLAEHTSEALINTSPWALIETFQWDIYSREFQYLMANRERFEEVFGRKRVQQKIYDTFLAQYQEVFVAEQLHDFGMSALREALKLADFQAMDTLKLMMNVHWYEYHESWTEYADAVVKYQQLAPPEDYETSNEVAWKFYLFVEKAAYLETARGWLQEIIDISPDPTYIDTYASLTYKLGERRKAIQLEQKALEMAQNFGEDPTHYQYQLRKFKEGK